MSQGRVIVSHMRCSFHLTHTHLIGIVIGRRVNQAETALATNLVHDLLLIARLFRVGLLGEQG